MSLINREALYEEACDLEAQALSYVAKIANDKTKIEEWKIWSAILIERTGFKHDIFDAPEELPSVQPEITPDGTLKVTVDADIASIGRILLSQTGTQEGGLYYKDEQPEESYMEGWCKGFNAAVDHCIGHVIHAPTIEPERKWETCFDCPLSNGCPKIRGCTNEQAEGYASNIPDDCPLSIEPERKTGKWIYGEHDVAMCDGYRCDKCGFFVPWDYQHKCIEFIREYKYCPNCGEKMEEPEDIPMEYFESGGR